MIEESEKETKSDKRTKKQKKEDYEKWKKINEPSGMAEAWGSEEEPQKKKTFWQKFWKGFWKKFKEFWINARKI